MHKYEKVNGQNLSKSKTELKAPPAHFLFLVFSKLQNIYIITFMHIQQLTGIKECRLIDKSLWFGRKLLAGEIFPLVS